MALHLLAFKLTCIGLLRQLIYQLIAGENAKRLVGMFLPKGAVEDLLEELRNQQLALQAEQAQHAQQPHADYHVASPELASQAFNGTDHVQQLAEFQTRLHTGSGVASSHVPQPASRHTYM